MYLFLMNKKSIFFVEIIGVDVNKIEMKKKICFLFFYFGL